MNSTPDHYAVLGLAPDATDAEIKRRYRKLMRAVHPDANANDPLAYMDAFIDMSLRSLQVEAPGKS